MKRNTRLFNLLSLIPAFGVFYGGYAVKGLLGLSFVYFLYQLGQNVSQIEATILTAFASVIAAVVAVLITQHFTRTREVEAGLLEQKRKEFVIFFDLFVAIMFPDPYKNEKQRNKQVTSDLIKVKRSVLIWGSNDLIWAWNEFEGKFRNLSDFGQSGEADFQLEILEMMHEILAAFRRELGHGKTPGMDELVGLFIKDEVLGTDIR